MTERSEDKWAQRRAARRDRPLPPVVVPEVVPARPANVDRAFVLLLLIGIPAVVGLIGIVIVVGAFNLRAGYRGARIVLTVLFAPTFLSLGGFLIAIVNTGFSPLMLIPIALCSLIAAAVILMWQADVSDYLDAARARR